MRIYKYQIENELRDLKTIDKYYFEDYVHRITSQFNNLVRIEENNQYRYYCTHCKQWHEDKKVNVKTIKICPHCGRKYKVITKRNVIPKIQDYVTVIETNNRNELIIRSFYFYKLYDKKTMNFDYDCFEVERINFDHNVYMKMHTYNNMGNICHANRDCYEMKRDRLGYYNLKLGDYYFYGYVITKQIKKLIKNTKYKYSCLDIIARRHIDILDYLKIYDKFNEIELLVKNNNFKLIREIIRNDSVPNELYDKKNYKYLKYDLTLKEFKNAAHFDLSKYEDIKAYGFIDAMNCVNRLNEFNIKTNKIVHYLYRKKQTVDYYKDYIEIASKIGMNTEDIRVLYPKKLTKAHDDVMKQYEISKNEYISKNIKEYAKELQNFIFKEKNLIIFPASSQEELIDESIKLDHCVRNYAEKMAKRSTSIFFIRSAKAKNKPYVTLELRNNKVIQCRGYKNNVIRPLDKKVKDFVNDWCNKFNLQSCFS